MCLFGVLSVEAAGLPPEVANEIPLFFRRCINDLSQRIGGPNPEARAFQVIATLEGGMMLARAYQDTEAFDRAVAGLGWCFLGALDAERRRLEERRQAGKNCNQCHSEVGASGSGIFR
jgi:hypothetical protein